MALTKKGKFWYGSTPEDTQAEIVRYSASNGYQAVKFATSACGCGGQLFELETDEDAGVALRRCATCADVQYLGDSAEYADEAELGAHECVCETDKFELVSGVALYEGSNDVRWYYIGCRCAQCQLVGVYADWKCEAGDADAFLARV